MFHLVQVFVWGAYKKPRELTWMTGVLLLLCTLGLAFTGYLLPWDQKAYWATRVGLGIASTTPGVGDSLRTLLQGGPEMGNLTLTRFFAIHTFVLPGLLILLVIVHVYLFRLHGVTPPWWRSPEQLQAEAEPFWPKQLLKDGVVWLVFLIGLAWWCYHQPAPLEAPADPSAPYEARPEWYFMFLFQLLRYFEGPYEVVGTFFLPMALFLLLLLWPFLDRNPHRDPRRRPVAMGLLGLATAGLVGLTIYAVATDVRMTEPAQAAAKTPAQAAEAAGPIQRADVAQLYNSHCVACHGVDGSGTQMRAGMPTIPDFTSLAWQMSQTDVEITHRIQDGNEPLMPAYRVKLAQQQILALAVYVRAFAVTATPITPAKPVQPMLPPAAHMSPVVIYRAYCLACHDATGTGRVARKAMPELPDFTDPVWQAARSDVELKQSILAGKGKFMVPMRDKLSLADAQHMVAYVRTFRGGKQVTPVEPQLSAVLPPPTQPRAVPGPQAAPAKQASFGPASAELAARTRVATGLYRLYCLCCHGTDGAASAMRPSMPAIPNFNHRPWQEGKTNAQLIVSILDGKGTLMPAFRGQLTEVQARDLAAYVRSFGPARPLPAQASSGEFAQRFQALQQEWNELQRQFQELSKPARKP